jgi:hypothetical protein
MRVPFLVVRWQIARFATQQTPHLRQSRLCNRTPKPLLFGILHWDPNHSRITEQSDPIVGTISAERGKLLNANDLSRSMSRMNHRFAFLKHVWILPF